MNRASPVKLCRFAGLLALLCLPAAVGAQSFFEVPGEFWETPRSAQLVLEQPALRRAVAACLARPDGVLVLHHGGGEENLLRVEELRGWLAALAVDAGRVELAGDLPGGRDIRIEIIARPSRGNK